MYFKTAIVFFLFIIQSGTMMLSAQTENAPILFIYDASGSMWGKLNNEIKKEIASNVLTQTISQLHEDQKIGLIAYGHRKKGDCSDVEFLVDLENTDKDKINSLVRSINPLGKTPLAHSAKLAIDQLTEKKSRATLILITDGIESCNGDLCKIIRHAKEAGIEFKLHIVGFGIKDGDLEMLKCAAREGDGQYYNANDSNELGEVLNQALHQKIDDPMHNHTFYAVKNGKPVDAWIKIVDKKTGKNIRGVRTYQDTVSMYLDVGEYSLSINPLEGSDIKNKTTILNKSADGPFHNTYSFDGGEVEITVLNNNEKWDATVKVLAPGSMEWIAGSRTYNRNTKLELDIGTYDIEILPLQIKGEGLVHKIENVEIKANQITPIIHQIKTGFLNVGVHTKNGELVDAVVKINDESGMVNIAGTRTYTKESNNPKKIRIIPGTYEVKITTLGKHKGISLNDIITVYPNKESTKLFQID